MKCDLVSVVILRGHALLRTHWRVISRRVAHVAHRGMRLHPAVRARSGCIEVDKLVV